GEGNADLIISQEDGMLSVMNSIMAELTAPAQIPETNPVMVSVRLKTGGVEGDPIYILNSNITVIQDDLSIFF
ncbi:MAG: hypothetical protein ACK4GL_12900, partial [Flavobacteriales bacterium]